jgi:ABC-type phosphate transport system substrate-binding protein
MGYRDLQVLVGIIAWLGLWLSALAADGHVPEGLVLAVVVHKSNPIDNLSTGTLRKILLGRLNEWDDHRKLILIERDADSSVYRQMLQLVLRMTPIDYKRHLLALEFQGAELPLMKTLNSDEGALQFTGSVPGAIALVGFVAPTRANTRIKILRIDGKLPGEAGYSLQ